MSGSVRHLRVRRYAENMPTPRQLFVPAQTMLSVPMIGFFSWSVCAPKCPGVSLRVMAPAPYEEEKGQQQPQKQAERKDTLRRDLP